MTLDELAEELMQVDDLLLLAKTKRNKLLTQKEDEIEEEQLHKDTDPNSALEEKELDLEEYKNELNKVLEINKLRKERTQIKNEIEEKQKQQDFEGNQEYI